MPEITCPGCGTVSHFEELRRSATEFCRSCDYPLFWARSTLVAARGGGSDGDTGLRRLPGTAGRTTVATVTCWACQEPNLVAATICVRCGSDLAGPPPAPAPEPQPAPVVEVVEEVVVVPKPSPWPWILLAVLFVAGLVVLQLVL
jgi:hypothetical protein